MWHLWSKIWVILDPNWGCTQVLVSIFRFFGFTFAFIGGLAASFCAAQLCSAVMWGKISDDYGRKPAVIIGTVGAAIGTLIFGFSKV